MAVLDSGWKHADYLILKMPFFRKFTRMGHLVTGRQDPRSVLGESCEVTMEPDAIPQTKGFGVFSCARELHLYLDSALQVRKIFSLKESLIGLLMSPALNKHSDCVLLDHLGLVRGFTQKEMDVPIVQCPGAGRPVGWGKGQLS